MPSRVAQSRPRLLTSLSLSSCRSGQRLAMASRAPELKLLQPLRSSRVMSGQPRPMALSPASVRPGRLQSLRLRSSRLAPSRLGSAASLRFCMPLSLSSLSSAQALKQATASASQMPLQPLRSTSCREVHLGRGRGSAS